MKMARLHEIITPNYIKATAKEILMRININIRNISLRKILYPFICAILTAYVSTAVIGVVYSSNEIPVIKTVSNKQNSTPKKVENISTSDIETRNIFKTKITSTVEQSTASQTNPQTKPQTISPDNLLGYNLLGIFQEQASPEAFIENKDKVVKVIKQGQMFEGFKLVKVNFDGVELLKDKHIQTLKFAIPKTTTDVAMSISDKTTPNKTMEKTVNNVDNISIRKEEVMNDTQDMNKLLTSMVIAPYYNGAVFVGFKFELIKADSLLSKIGLKRGDIIKSINGTEIKSVQQALDLFSTINNITAVNIDIIRGTEKKSIFVDIKQ